MRWTAIVVALLTASVAYGSDDLPLLGLAHVGIRVSDLERARSFYSGVLGLENAFTTRKDDGTVFVAYFKVNDRQYIEIFPGLRTEDTIPMTHIAMWSALPNARRRPVSAVTLPPTRDTPPSARSASFLAAPGATCLPLNRTDSTWRITGLPFIPSKA